MRSNSWNATAIFFCVLEEGMDGVVEIDDLPMRQVPSYSFGFGFATWVSESGIVRNRFYDPFHAAWSWGAVRRPVFDAAGRLGFNIYGRFRLLEQVIALAWVPRRRPMSRLRRVCRRDPNGDLSAHNLAWSDEMHDDPSTDDDSDDEDENGDAYRPLVLKMGLIPCINQSMQISQSGRVKTAYGSFKGSYALGPCRFFPIPHVGLLPLNLASQLLFTGDRDRKIGRPPPRVLRTMQQLKAGRTIQEIARDGGIKEATAWSYAHAALQQMSTSSARQITEKITEDTPLVLKALGQLSTETPLALAGRLSDVVHLLTRLFAAEPSWRENPHRYSIVCMARTLLQREQ